jgi:mannose-1-phosphate guanylyltransferase
LSAQQGNVGGVILCAGMGGRMGTLTVVVPKPLLPVLNCPLLWWNLARMRCVAPAIAINIHHRHEAFAALAPLFRERELHVELVYEPALSGPFGGVLACKPTLPAADDLLVFAGDGLYEADFPSILARHREEDAELTICLASVENGSRYGVVATDSNGFVTNMHEKPAGLGYTQSASCGVYIVSKRLLLRFADAQQSLDWVDVVSVLLDEGAIVATARVDDWHDVGTPSDLLRTNLDLLSRDVISLIARKIEPSGGSVWSQDRRQGDRLSGVSFEGRVLIGAHAEIRPGAMVANSVIGPGALVEAGARINDSVVLEGSRVPANHAVVNTIWS